jgi:LAGLIDADG endonuclease
MKNIQKFFGVGFLRILKKDNLIRYEVNNLNDLNDIIIPHFIKYPMCGNKQISLYKFKYIINKVLNKEHYLDNELIYILSLASNMNEPYFNKG